MENPEQDLRKPPEKAESGLDSKHGCFPDLDADDREFLLNGSTPEEHAWLFPPEKPE